MITRRTFSKRTGTLSAALGLGILPSLTKRLHAEDTSTNNAGPYSVKYQWCNLLGGALTGNPATDGCTWRYATQQECDAAECGMGSGIIETAEANWMITGEEPELPLPCRTRTISRTFMSVLPNNCVDPLWMTRIISIENQVTYADVAYTQRSTTTIKHRVRCEMGSPKAVLYSIHTVDENEALPPGQLYDAGGVNFLHTPSNQGQPDGEDRWTAGLQRPGTNTFIGWNDRNNGIFNTVVKPSVNTNFVPDFDPEQPFPPTPPEEDTDQHTTTSLTRISVKVVCCAEWV